MNEGIDRYLLPTLNSLNCFYRRKAFLPNILFTKNECFQFQSPIDDWGFSEEMTISCYLVFGNQICHPESAS